MREGPKPEVQSRLVGAGRGRSSWIPSRGKGGGGIREAGEIRIGKGSNKVAREGKKGGKGGVQKKVNLWKPPTVTKKEGGSRKNKPEKGNDGH